MIVSFIAGALGAPLDELGIDIDGDGIVDQVVPVEEVSFEPDLSSELIEVEGYYRADGTWVEPHFRTAPDSSLTNNLSWWDLVNA